MDQRLTARRKGGRRMTGKSDTNPDSETPDVATAERFLVLPSSRDGKTTLAPDPSAIKVTPLTPKGCSGCSGCSTEQSAKLTVSWSAVRGIRAHAVMLCEAGQRWHNRGALLRLWCWWRCSIAHRCRPWPRCSSGLSASRRACRRSGRWFARMATARPCVEQCQRRDYRPRSKASARCGLL